MDDARERLLLDGDNTIPSPNRHCPRWLCCLLPCLDSTPSMIAYKACLPDAAYVLRDGDDLCVDADGLVKGDVVILKPGIVVPADVHVLDCTENFTTSCFDKKGISLTHVPASSKSEGIERFCFAGCTVLRGQGKGVIINTGEKTLMAYLIENRHWPISQKAKSMITK
mmetsp:Transcript_12295/g.14932  ORF Transcript_12295/g.14932 Transcript_12295/m.14932 type:complete len:168 (+) Transcript_12295:36-539(+)